VPNPTIQRHFLVTAGNTRELIDRVRDWGNIFTGNTGFNIAKALLPYGHVTLITSNAQHRDEAQALGMTTEAFRSHADLMKILESRVTGQSFDAIFMTAAVADYVPDGAFAVLDRKPLPDGTEQWIVQPAQAGKIKSNHAQVAFLGRQTEKIVDRFRRDWAYKGLLVKFKLEVGLSADQLIEVGKKSRVASDADYLIANTLDMVQGTAAGAYLISREGQRFIPRDDLASACAALVG
jgi:phosphopantothenate-cysteine ligase/phosphopantothenoylcysteine decarboxylase/phosphopantothenate--cysteine ligase